MLRFSHIITINSKIVGSIYVLFYGVFELIKGISGSNVDNKYTRPSPGIEHSDVWTSLVLKPKFFLFVQLNKCHLVTIPVHVEWYAECCTLLNTLYMIDLFLKKVEKTNSDSCK